MAGSGPDPATSPVPVGAAGVLDVNLENPLARSEAVRFIPGLQPLTDASEAVVRLRSDYILQPKGLQPAGNHRGDRHGCIIIIVVTGSYNICNRRNRCNLLFSVSISGRLEALQE